MIIRACGYGRLSNSIALAPRKCMIWKSGSWQGTIFDIVPALSLVQPIQKQQPGQMVAELFVRSIAAYIFKSEQVL